ncbi:unnamed protein product [Orchesella dallaii]|uniref:Uncharacterized protein n=1 Tax=Orchesella dallaii TaxID=48710 RepID=A0ABP1R2T9_9HEXA
MCGGGCGSGSGSSSSKCACLQQLVADPCYQKLCCNQRRKVCYKPFIPSYERCDEEIKMGKLLGFDYQRRWFCERNVWMCKVYGQCGGGCCC